MAACRIDLRRHERPEDAAGGGGLRAVLAEAEDVRPVVGTRERGVFFVAAESGAHILEAVCGHRHAHARGADEHAKVDLPTRNRLRNIVGVVGIIAGIRGFGTEVQEFRVRVLGEDRLLQFKATVIGANGDFHDDAFLMMGENCVHYTRPRFPVQQNAARHKMPRDMPWDRAWRSGKPSRGFKPPHTH